MHYLVTEVEDEQDKNYAPPKRSRPEPPAPTASHDKDGNEIIEDVSSDSDTGPRRKVRFFFSS